MALFFLVTIIYSPHYHIYHPRTHKSNDLKLELRTWERSRITLVLHQILYSTMEQKHILANEIAKYEIYVISVRVRISCYDSRFLTEKYNITMRWLTWSWSSKPKTYLSVCTNLITDTKETQLKQHIRIPLA